MHVVTHMSQVICDVHVAQPSRKAELSATRMSPTLRRMSTTRDVRKRRLSKARSLRTGRPNPPLALDQRLTRMSRSRGTHVAYHLAMSGGRIDRDAWAREVDALAERFDPAPSGGSNKSAFARRIGRTRKTLERWAARSTDVSHDSVSAVLEALNLPPKESSEILQRVGAYYVVYVDKETPM